MSANEDELPASTANEMIDSSWESMETIIESLEEGDEAIDKYDFDDATEMINYIDEELIVGEHDIGRVLEEYEQDRCPYCEESEGVDPTLDKKIGAETRDSYRVNTDEVIRGFFTVDCSDESHDVFFSYEEEWSE